MGTDITLTQKYSVHNYREYTSKLCINYQLDAQVFFICIISLYMFQEIMLFFRRSHYCIHAAYVNE